MNSLNKREATVIASPKGAALYFDKIYPLPGRPEHILETEELLDCDEEKVSTILTESASDYRDFFEDIMGMFKNLSADELNLRISKLDFSGPRLSDPREQMMYYASSRCNISASSELVLSEVLSDYNPEKSSTKFRKISKPAQSVLVQLTNLNLVDASGCSWEQIFSFREDQSARDAFVRMRDFLFRNCSNMTSGQLQDHIASLLYEYESKRKQHGFEARAASWDVVLNSQNVLRTACAGALGVTVSQLGSPGERASLATALTGVALVFDVSRALIQHKRKLIEGEIFESRHPMHWAFLAKKQLSIDLPLQVAAPGFFSKLKRIFA
ncbi:MAG: hypothetical protein JWO30_3450 [Fibrobacteres bacterium]|nr:hypothetical protein [Fibrobacterota bacterium]